MGPVTVRDVGSTVWWVLCTASIGGLGLLMAFDTGEIDPTPPKRILLVAASVLWLAAAGWRVSRTRVVVSTDGLLVENFFTVRRFAWTSVAGIESRHEIDVDGNSWHKIVVVRHDGSRVTMRGFPAQSTSTHDRATAAIRSVAPSCRFTEVHTDARQRSARPRGEVSARSAAALRDLEEAAFGPSLTTGPSRSDGPWLPSLPPPPLPSPPRRTATGRFLPPPGHRQRRMAHGRRRLELDVPRRHGSDHRRDGAAGLPVPPRRMDPGDATDRLRYRAAYLVLASGFAAGGIAAGRGLAYVRRLGHRTSAAVRLGRVTASPDLGAATAHARARLATELPSNLTYHRAAHTTDDVVPAVLALADDAGVGGRDRVLLETAAWFHDLGFVVRADGHERIGVGFAREVLPGLGYTTDDLDVIEGLILATTVPQRPRTPLEELLCDADLDVLGRTDFFERNDALRAESAALGRPTTTAQWYTDQATFVGDHRYFSSSARRRRDEGKAANLAGLEQRAQDALEAL